MSEYTSEPWRLRRGEREAPDDMIVMDEKGASIADCTPGNPYMTPAEAEANARRIAAAVNACKGIPIEALEANVVQDLLEALHFYIMDCEVERLEYHHDAYSAAKAAVAKAEGQEAQE